MCWSNPSAGTPLCKLLKKYAFVPERLVTDDLRSYARASRDLGIEYLHERGRWKNNRAENSHLNPRRRVQHFQCPTPSHVSSIPPRAPRRGDEHVARGRHGRMKIRTPLVVRSRSSRGNVTMPAKAIRRNKLLEFFASLPPCLVGLEASGSAHHWARELMALGHKARIMPPAYVKPYIRRQKNDASDAAAICEAVTRPSMRFVGVRSLENQAALMRHKTREMAVSQRMQLLNALRGHLTEVGVIATQGPRYVRELADLIEACDETIPFEVCEALAPLVVQLRNLDEAIARLDRSIAKLAQRDETARRLMSIPGFGPITASAMAATIQDTSNFAGPREFAAYLGLTPKQNSSGGKPKLGRIRRWAIGTCASCSSWARMRCCFIVNPTPTRCGCGRRS
jgi:transposase